jgi:PAS domain S-box-containing protein
MHDTFPTSQVHLDDVIRGRAERLAVTSQYAIAIGTVLVIAAFRLALDPVLGGRVPYMLSLPALLILAWYLGRGPVIAATAVSAAVSTYLFVEPRGSLVPHGVDLLQCIVYVFSVACALAVAQVAERARRESEHHASAFREEAHARLSEEEAFRTSFELAAVGSAQVDPIERRFLRVNRKLAEITGYSTGELLDLTLDELTHPEDRESARTGYERILTGRDLEHVGEARLIRNDGQVIWVQINAAVICDAVGRPTAMLCVIQDVTPHRRNAEAVQRQNSELEARVRERTEQLEASNHELESFSYSVSHDLRAPLRHIAGFAELLDRRARGQLDETARRHLDAIIEASRRAGRLVDDLLGFARMSRASMQDESVDMEALVEDAKRTVGSEDAIDWRVEPLPSATGDPALLRQVWTNLLSNAVKYSAPAPAPSIRVRGEPVNGEVVYSVSDNGVGFDMRYADKLFGVFQRLHAGDRFEGTGIGLANVRRIVQRHGGRTWAEGRPGEGATFYFSLPCDGARDADGSEAHPARGR